MLVIRLAKLLMVAALAAFAFLVTYDNIVDYGANYQFVQHVLSMDTTFPDNTLKIAPSPIRSCGRRPTTSSSPLKVSPRCC